MKRIKSLLCAMLAAVTFLWAAGLDCPRSNVVYLLWKQFGGASSGQTKAVPTSDRFGINTESGLNGKVCAKENFDKSVYNATAFITHGLLALVKLVGFDPNGTKNTLVIASGNFSSNERIAYELTHTTLKKGYVYDIYDYRNGVYTFIITACSCVSSSK